MTTVDDKSSRRTFMYPTNKVNNTSVIPELAERLVQKFPVYGIISFAELKQYDTATIVCVQLLLRGGGR